MTDLGQASMTPEQLEAQLEAQKEPKPRSLTPAELRLAEIAVAQAQRRAAKEPEAPTQSRPAPAAAELSAPARVAQQVIKAIDERQRERARLEAARLRLEAAREPFLREAHEEMRRKIAAAEAEYSKAVDRASQEVDRAVAEISALDHSLEQLRRQLAAELGKLDPALAGGKEAQ